MRYLILFFLLFPTVVWGQITTKEVGPKLGPNPLFIVDSVKIQRTDLKNLNPKTVARVMVLTDNSAKKRYNKEGNDGVVIIETKTFIRARYINLFRQASSEYDRIYKKQGNDSIFQYVLNGKLLNKNVEGKLAEINKDLLISVDVVEGQLENQFGVTKKQYGVIVKAKEPPKHEKAE